jgi:hypothetical protein
VTPTIDQIRAQLDYDPDTGVFTRKVSGGGVAAGSRAGGKDAYGHTTISVCGKRMRAARLAWAIMTGEWPDGDVDHKNRVRDDDRWCNLRLASRSQNCANTLAQSGMKGASWVTEKRKWKSQIRIAGKNTHIGYFDCEIDAHEAYKKKAVEHFGEFAAW